MARLLFLLAATTLTACASAPRAPAFDPAGTFDFMTEFGGNSLPGTLTLRRTSEGLTGSLSSAQMPGELVLSGITENGRKLQLRVPVQGNEMVMNIEFVEDDRFTGSWAIADRFSGNISGTRRPAR